MAGWCRHSRWLQLTAPDTVQIPHSALPPLRVTLADINAVVSSRAWPALTGTVTSSELETTMLLSPFSNPRINSEAWEGCRNSMTKYKAPGLRSRPSLSFVSPNIFNHLNIFIVPDHQIVDQNLTTQFSNHCPLIKSYPMDWYDFDSSEVMNLLPLPGSGFGPHNISASFT